MSSDDKPTGYIPRLDGLGRPITTEIGWPKHFPEEYDAEQEERAQFTRHRSERSYRTLLLAVLDGLRGLDNEEGQP